MFVTPSPLETRSMCMITGVDRLEILSGGNGTVTEVTILTSILSSMLSLMIVVGNGLIIVSVVIVKKLRQPANYLIVSLALSDFLVGFIVLPLTILDHTEGWLLGSMMCDVYVSFDVICCTASIMNLCMISIDRYFIITRPMTYQQRRSGKLMAILIATAWLISCLIIIPALFGFTENVKDGPGWLNLSCDDVVEDSGAMVTGPTSPLGKHLNESYAASAAIDHNATTLWDPGRAPKKSKDWHFTIDLGQPYKLSKVGLRNGGDNTHDVVQYNVQAYMCENVDGLILEKTFKVNAGTDTLQKENIGGHSEARCLRVSVNQTIGGNQPRILEFTIYGEKTQGKTCLISQEVWFTIYSTVGAFYIPLAVMLFMYWKIYAEASKFKMNPSQRKESWTASQGWKRAPREPLVSASSNSSCQTNMTVTRKNSVDSSLRSPRRTKHGSEPEEHSCLDECGNEILISEVEDEEINIADYDEDAVFSDFQFFSCKMADNKTESTIASEEDCCGKNIQRTENKLGKDLNGNCQQLDSNNTLHLDPTCKHKKISFCDSLLPCNGTTHCHKTEPVSILRTRTEQIINKDVTNGILNTQSLPLNGDINNEPATFSIGDKTLPNHNRNDFVPQANLESENAKKTRQKPPQTKPSPEARRQLEDMIQTYHKPSLPRRGILSRVAICCEKSLRCEDLSSSPMMSSSRNAKKSSPSRRRSSLKRLSFSRPKKKKSKFYSGWLETDSSVFDQIKRRVSMAASRDRMRNVKATRTLGIIVGAFTFCWLPFFIVTFLRPFVCENPESPQDCIPRWLVRLVLWLGYLNSALNPIIYIGFSPDLRKTFRYLLSCKCTNVDRRLARTELRQAICREKRASVGSITRCVPAESIM